MSLHQLKYVIPKRASSCVLNQELFKEGMEVISVLDMDRGKYVRKDYCLSCFEQNVQSQDLSFWKSPVGEKRSQKRVLPHDQRVLLFFKERVMGHETLKELQIGALALYLEWRKLLLKRGEKQINKVPYLVYECVESEENFLIRKISLSMSEVEQVISEVNQVIQDTVDDTL